MSANITNTKKVTLLGMLAAIAYAVIFVCHFLIPPVAGFLTLDVKDTIIAIAGFIFGPLSAALVGVVVAAVEMVTISATGPIGLVMNILSSCCFACVAALIYKAQAYPEGRYHRPDRGLPVRHRRHAAVELPHYPHLHGCPPGNCRRHAGAGVPALQPGQVHPERCPDDAHL